MSYKYQSMLVWIDETPLLHLLQFFNSKQENCFCFLATIASNYQKCLKRKCWWELRFLKPIIHHSFKNTQYLNSLIETTYHFVRAKFVGWDGTNGALKFRSRECRSRHTCPNHPVICQFSAREDYLTNLGKLGVGTLNCRTDRVRPSYQCSLVCNYQQLRGMLVLSAHYKDCHAESGYRANCLYPCRPIRFAEPLVKAGDNQCRTCTEREKWIAHHTSLPVSEIYCHTGILS